MIREIEKGSFGIAMDCATGSDNPRKKLMLDALEAQRDIINRLRDAGRMGSALSERLDTELDLDAMGARNEGKRLTDGGES